MKMHIQVNINRYFFIFYFNESHIPENYSRERPQVLVDLGKFEKKSKRFGGL
jgi:hypothetical protein